MMDSTGESWELICVNDGSRDRSLQLLLDLHTLEWWPEADTYPTVADLPLEIQNWVIRNKRGIARAFQKAGGAL